MKKFISCYNSAVDWLNAETESVFQRRRRQTGFLIACSLVGLGVGCSVPAHVQQSVSDTCGTCFPGHKTECENAYASCAQAGNTEVPNTAIGIESCVVQGMVNSGYKPDPIPDGCSLKAPIAATTPNPQATAIPQ